MMRNPLNPRNRNQKGQNTRTMNLSSSEILLMLACIESFIDISKGRGMGGDGFDEIVNRLVAQERKMAKLEIQQRAQRPG